MPLFPREFPFNKPVDEDRPPAQPTVQPAQPPVQMDEPLAMPAAPVTVQAVQERRRSPRQSIAAKGLLRNEHGNGQARKVVLSNISMLGIRFLSSESMSVGDRAHIKLEVGPLRWEAKLRIVHSVPADSDQFQIGCEFIANELARPVARAA